MSELFLPLMIMAFTIAVMLGLVLVFRGWMAERDRIVAQPDHAQIPHAKAAE
jgi:hypothetical protein